MKFRSYLKAGIYTTLNIIFYALKRGRYLWLEGRVRDGRFHNWAHRFRYRPQNFAQPRTEAELVEVVKNAKSLRLFGSAHSFNDGIVSDETLVSLDNFSGVVWKDLAKKQMAFKGGTRIRDVVKFLLDEGLAFSSLPSHDAQSIGGILSTDVHGTGRDWGFVSELVVSLKVIDARGQIRECVPTDDLFRAAIGGVGAAGIISEVVVQAVDRFNIEQKVEMSKFSIVMQNLDRLLQENEHLSLYVFPFTDNCQINIWNSTTKEKSTLGSLREFVSISSDALISAWFGGFMAYSGLLRPLSRLAYGFKRGTDLVLESNEGYNRTIYHLHQELEFTIPFEDTIEMCRRFRKLYEEMYSADLPYGFLEVRFTPPGHLCTFIGAGRERRSTWIDLIINDSAGFEKYYAAAEDSLKQLDARPHLGKFCQSLTTRDLARLHEEHFAKFLEVAAQQDPDKKFANVFTRRLFWN
jgi:hypothetical protein